MRTLAWMAAFTFGYYLGYWDGRRWGFLFGRLDAATERLVDALVPAPTRQRRGWTWKGRR